MAVLRVALLLVAWLGVPLEGVDNSSSEGMLPVNVQVPLIVKVLSYDRALPDRPGRSINIAVLYQSAYPESRTLGRQLLRTFQHQTFSSVAGRPAQYFEVAYENPEQLRDYLQAVDIHVLYITPLRAVDAGVVIRTAQAAAAATVTPLREHVRRGAAIGVLLQDGRPHMLVNVKAAKAQGMELSAQLLRLAEIVGL